MTTREINQGRVVLLPCDDSFFTPVPRKLTSRSAEQIKCDCGCMDALFLHDILMLRDQHGVRVLMSPVAVHAEAMKTPDRVANITYDGPQ